MTLTMWLITIWTVMTVTGVITIIVAVKNAPLIDYDDDYNYEGYEALLKEMKEAEALNKEKEHV